MHMLCPVFKCVLLFWQLTVGQEKEAILNSACKRRSRRRKKGVINHKGLGDSGKPARAGYGIIHSLAFVDCGGHFKPLSSWPPKRGDAGLNHMLRQKWSQTKAAETSCSSVEAPLNRFLRLTQEQTFQSNFLISAWRKHSDKILHN